MQLRGHLGLGSFSLLRVFLLRGLSSAGDVELHLIGHFFQAGFNIRDACIKEAFALIKLQHIFVANHVNFTFRAVGAEQGEVFLLLLRDFFVVFALLRICFDLRFLLLRRQWGVKLTQRSTLLGQFGNVFFGARGRHGLAVVGHAFFVNTAK